MRYLKINRGFGNNDRLPIICTLIAEVERNAQNMSSLTATQQIISKVERIVYLVLKQYLKTDKSVEEYFLLVEDCKNYITLHLTRNESSHVSKDLEWIIRQYILQKFVKK
ncbi:hypothetical protein BN1088_290002 [Sphingobacterium sp. PM2-P1-29]|nr:hypothetical protein BN1088_290002 [Sphingobacterium sp. PM2-P1-29]